MRGTSYASFDDLEHYCRCVAGSIGRLSLGVFGSADPGRGRVAGRRARGRPAADEHPARRPRGSRHRPGLPAGRGPRAIRLHARARRAGRCGHDAPARPGRPRQVRGRPGALLVRDRAGADAAARPAQRRVRAARWPASTAGCSTASPPTPQAALRAAAVPAGQGEGVVAGLAGAAGHGAARTRGCDAGRPRMTARRRGRHRRRASPASPPRSAWATRGADVTLLEAAPAAGRRGDLVQSRGPDHRQRPARLPALLHGLPAACSAGSASTAMVAIQDRFDVTVLSPRGQARLRRSACAGAAAPGPRPGRLPAAAAGRPADESAGRPWPCAASTRPTRPRTPSRFGGWLAGHGPAPARPGGCSGTCSRCPP